MIGVYEHVFVGLQLSVVIVTLQVHRCVCETIR